MTMLNRDHGLRRHFNVPVDEFTTPNPVTATSSASVDELQKLMRDNGIRHLPIVDDGRVVGIVSDRDVRVAIGLNVADRTAIVARDLMTSDPVTVSSEMPLDEVAFEMSSKKVGSVIVNDEDDELLGIFTVTDALNALIEISREIQ